MNKKLVNEIINFGWVGIICFCMDFGLLYSVTNFFGVNYLISSAIAFSVSVVVNYILSLKYVFVSNKSSQSFAELAIFIGLSVIGLVINQIIMWLGVELLALNYMLVKIASTSIVMIYNFISRKLLVANKRSK